MLAAKRWAVVDAVAAHHRTRVIAAVAMAVGMSDVPMVIGIMNVLRRLPSRRYGRRSVHGSRPRRVGRQQPAMFGRLVLVLMGMCVHNRAARDHEDHGKKVGKDVRRANHHVLRSKCECTFHWREGQAHIRVITSVPCRLRETHALSCVAPANGALVHAEHSSAYGPLPTDVDRPLLRLSGLAMSQTSGRCCLVARRLKFHFADSETLAIDRSCLFFSVRAPTA